LLAIDDLNDWIGCLGGHPQSKTPNIDALAKRGVLFKNAHCAAPLCNPSRVALMTGVLPSKSGIYDNNQPFRQSPVLRDSVTLSRHFSANGYRSVGGGKIFHLPFPDAASWEEYFPSQTLNKPKDPYPSPVPAGGDGLVWNALDVPDSKMGDHQVVDWAIGELNKPQTKPLFLACGLYRPHLPWYTPKKYFDMHPLEKIELPATRADDLDDVPAAGKAMAKADGDHARIVREGKWKEAVQAYLASISFADAQVGRLMAGLDRSPLARNTIIVLWSDHGWHLGEKLHWRKFSLWEEATRNVFAIVAPGMGGNGKASPRTVSLLDVYPTLVDLCGLSAKAGLDGVSLRPLLNNPMAPWDRPSLTTYFRNNHSVRDERWRYTRYADGSEELYDHDADPSEWTNLARDPRHAGVKKKLGQWMPRTNAPDSAHAPGLADVR
jgi:arylsulfatase A-like enzyme